MEQVASIEARLTATRAAQKAYKRARGIDNLRKAEYFAKQVTSQEEQLAAVRAQLSDVEAEVRRRS